jgi:hypothetical protein
MLRGSWFLVGLVSTTQILCALPSVAGAPAATSPSVSAENRTERYFQSIRKDRNLLLTFLRDMPKGGDLHNHLSGAIYAESLIQWAAERGECVDPKTQQLSVAPCGGEKASVPVSNAFSDAVLYRSMVDAFSMRNWQLSGQSGHDHFFDTFSKFGAASHGADGKMLAETAARAASQHEVYQELMLTPTGQELAAVVQKAGWDDDFAKLREKMLANGMAEAVAAARREIDEGEAGRSAALACASNQPDLGCQIVQRYLFQVLRGLPKQLVFAQMLCAFEAAISDPRFVGLNLVMPEDDYVPMRDFKLHMRMLQYLHSVYPKVHISLHAGELAEGMVPPEGLSFHVHDSIQIAHAERIGHGVDIMNETQPLALLREMARRNVMVEICLTSNAVILGVQGSRHPLHDYLTAGVPVALATDDEGVSRSDMTHEYLRGAEEQGLSYAQLKKMARTSLQYSFLPGDSLWNNPAAFVAVKACAAEKPGTKLASAACQKFLNSSEKARLQWKLEGQFREFEAQSWPLTDQSSRAAAHR